MNKYQINIKKLKKYLPSNYVWKNKSYRWTEVPNSIKDDFVFRKLNINQQEFLISMNLGSEAGIDDIIFNDSQQLIETLSLINNENISDIFVETKSDESFLRKIFKNNIKKLDDNFELSKEKEINLDLSKLNINVVDWTNQDYVFNKLDILLNEKPFNYRKLKEVSLQINPQLWKNEDFLFKIADKYSFLIKNIDGNHWVVKDKSFWNFFIKNDLTHILLNSTFSYDLSSELKQLYVESGQFTKDFMSDKIKLNPTDLASFFEDYPGLVKNRKLLQKLKTSNTLLIEENTIEILKHYSKKDFKNTEDFMDFYIDVLPLAKNNFYANRVEHLSSLFPNSIDKDGYLIERFFKSKEINAISYDNIYQVINEVFQNIKNPEDIFNFYINNLPQEYKSGKIPRQLQQYEIKNKEQLDKLYNLELYNVIYKQNDSYFYSLDIKEVEKVAMTFNKFIDKNIPKHWLENIDVVKHNINIIFNILNFNESGKKEIKNLLKNENNCITLIKKDEGVIKFIDPKYITENIVLAYFDKTQISFKISLNQLQTNYSDINFIKDNLNIPKTISNDLFLKIDFCLKLIDINPQYLVLCHPLVLNSKEVKLKIIEKDINIFELNINLTNFPNDIKQLVQYSKENNQPISEMYQKIKLYNEISEQNYTDKPIIKKNKI